MRLRPHWFQALLWLVLLGMIALIVLTAFQAQAQELPDAPIADKKFIVITAMTLGSAALDAWSTNRNLAHGYRELNPILGGHPSSGKVWVFCMGESTGWSVVAYFVKRSTRKSSNRAVRNAWMFFPALSFAGHSYGGIHNIHIYDPRYPKVKR